MINYLVGDATHPTGGNSETRVIAHCCNDIGGWGAGFVLALNKLSPDPKAAYKAWYRGELPGGCPMELGCVQIVKAADKLYVANMIGQRDIRTNTNGVPPIRYDAIKTCMEKVAQWAIKHQATIHMPRIGCGLAGGTWEEIEKILLEVQEQFPVEMYVYDLP